MSCTNTPMLPQPLAGELLAAPLIASLATFSEDATIHLVPVWFLWNGEALLVTTADSSSRRAETRRVGESA